MIRLLFRRPDLLEYLVARTVTAHMAALYDQIVVDCIDGVIYRRTI